MSSLVPEGWEIKTLSDVTHNLDGKRVPLKSTDRALRRGRYRYFGASGVIDYVDDYIFDGEYILLGEDGENVLSRVLPLAFKVSGQFWVNNHAHVMQPTKGNDIGYICEFLESLDYSIIASGSAQPKVTQGELRKIKVHVPPLPEQQKIAKILTSVDEVIEKTQAQINKLKDLKTGMMQELLTNGIGHTEFKDSPVGRIPAEWEVRTLLHICSSKYAIVDGPFGSNLKTEHYRPSGIPVFQSGFVTSNKFIEKKYVYVDQSKYDEQKRSSAKAGDILMAKIGMNAGACAIIPFNHPVGILAGNSLKITVDNDVVLSDFILGIIHSMQNTGEIRRLLTETAQPAISITTLKKMNIPVPPIEEQKRIVNTFHSIDNKIDIEINRLNSRKQLKKALMQDLLTGKVRVKTETTNTEVAVS